LTTGVLSHAANQNPQYPSTVSQRIDDISLV